VHESQVVTAEGRGVWGGRRYEVRFMTSLRTYADSTHVTSKTIIHFVLEFGSPDGGDRRWFESEAARRSFVDKSFSELVLREVPESKREPQEVASPLQAVVGEYLSSVTFVMDYLQLDFSGYGFNMYSWPTVTLQNRTLAQRDDGSLIGETLMTVDEYLDKGLVLQFKNGSFISLSLRLGRDFPCPEVAEFHGPKAHFLKIWQAGEAPFPFD